MSAGKHGKGAKSKKGRTRPEGKSNGKSPNADDLRVGTVVETRAAGRAGKRQISSAKKEVPGVGTVVETRGSGTDRSGEKH